MIAELYPPDWFDRAADGASGQLRDVQIELADVCRDGDLLTGTVRYRVGADEWTQQFAAQRFDADRLHADLANAGLAFDAWLTPDHVWFAAVADH